MLKKASIQKIIMLSLCILCIAGFFMPAATVRLSFLGFSQETSFSLATFFENNYSDSDRLDFNQSDLGNIAEGNEMLQSVIARIIFSAAAYTLSLILLLAALVLIAIGKAQQIRLAALIISLASFVSAGIVISTVQDVLIDTVTDMLGFLALLLNLEGMLNISLGAGYFVTLFALIVLFFVNIAIVIDKGKKMC